MRTIFAVCQQLPLSIQASQEAHSKSSSYAVGEYPRECCGIVCGSLRTITPAKIVYHSHVDGGSYFSEADQEAAKADCRPIYPVEYVVVSIHCDRPRGAKQFAWDAEQQKYVRVGENA